jgi:hypothetical protein
MKIEAMDGFASLVMMCNSDQNKYGPLMETMSTSFSLGNNTYPKTKEKALDALSNHKIDKTYFDNQKKNKEKESKQSEDKAKGEHGETGSKRSFGQRTKDNMICYCCGKKGHGVPQCEQKDNVKRGMVYK